jgi:glucose dehydrogenase
MKPIRILVLILCVGFVSVAWGQKPTCKAHTPWTEFHRHNMQRWNPCEKVLNVHNVGNLSLKWSYKTGNSVQTSPAVANGVVYVGSDDSKVYALNASTGTKLWGNGATGSAVDSSPAVANEAIYVASIFFVYALNAKTGALLWTYATGGVV